MGPLEAYAAGHPVAPAHAVRPPLAFPEGDAGRLAHYFDRLRAASCPEGAAAEPTDLGLSVKPITLGRLGIRRSGVGELTYVAGFALDSDNPHFGGLSGVDFLDDGSLFAVSDQGDRVWIDMDEDGVTPVSARISPLLDADGTPLQGKLEADAEGVAANEGWAFVSFERDHRVLAYDLAGCGSASRGAPINGVSLPQAMANAGIEAEDNGGPEPLAVTPDGYLFIGVETQKDGAGPLSARPLESAEVFDMSVGEGAPAFVGADLLVDEDGDVRLFTLHRGYSKDTGNAIVIGESRLERHLNQADLPARIVSEIDERSRYEFRKTSERRLAEMGAILFNVDNFEAIAARDMGDGRVRLYILSDDNFSASQRTLMMVFDLAN